MTQEAPRETAVSQLTYGCIPLEAVRQRIAAVSPAHPRLFASQPELTALAARCRERQPESRIAEAIAALAEATMEIEPICRTLQGRRLLGESRRCLKRMLVLAMACQLTGKRDYARRGIAEMLAVAEFSDWNPSHFLDVAEMTLAMAIGYDWLYSVLDEEQRKTIRDAIIDKGLRPSLEQYNGWVRANNNWGQVCHGGMVAGALAVCEDEPALAETVVHRAVNNVTVSLKAFAPYGSYPEGPGYWSYGTTYNVVLVDLLESVLGTDFLLTAAPGFAMTGQYMAMITGPSGRTFNYADGGDSREFEPALYWFAERFSRPDWIRGENANLDAALRETSLQAAASSRDRFLPLALLWLGGEKQSSLPGMPLHWSSGGTHSPITVHRSSWDDPGTVFVGFKGGTPAANHGHMDIGSFVLDADGIRWAWDLGAEGYHGIESRGMNLWNSNQDSDRWRIFRLNNLSHNTLVIDNKPQTVRGIAPFIHFSDEPEFPHSLLDMSPVYAGQAEEIYRGIALLPSGQVLIQDWIRGARPGVPVRWGMVTRAEPDRLPGRELTLRSGPKHLRMEILGSPYPWEEYPTAEPPNEWDSPNPGTRMLGFAATVPETGNLEFGVVITPGSRLLQSLPSVTLRPFEVWRGVL